jgi:hypothetical protein
MPANDKPPDRLETGSPARIAAELTDILRVGLLALAQAGEADMACRLAARACATLRKEQPDQWQVFNKLLHRLSPMAARAVREAGKMPSVSISPRQP